MATLDWYCWGIKNISYVFN